MNISSEEYYFDIGANLTHSAFKSVLDEVIEVSQKNGVQLLSVTGSDLLESQRALAIAKKYPESIISTAGIHPHQAKNYTKSYFSEIIDLLKEDLVRSIGETGLDFYRDYSTPSEKEKSFGHIWK